MYRSTTNGGSRGKSGIFYSWGPDDTVDAPKGDLDHVESLEWVEDSEVEPDSDKPIDGTKKEIKAWLDAHGVPYDSTALKSELLEALENA